MDFKKDVAKYKEKKNDNPFRKNDLKERTERTGLTYSTKQKQERWISIIIILKQVKKPVIYHSPLSSKYIEESTWFLLQSIGLE